jgi:FAD binding domain-containing protein/berberine-like enzyme
MVSDGAFPNTSVASAVEALTRGILGDVILPSHDEYDRARALFNGALDRMPDAIVRPRVVADIVAAVRYAREAELPLAVRGGGHHVAGYAAVDGGVTIDLSLMRNVYVDRERRVARVEGGALWSDVDRATQRYGLATPGGTAASVGVGGFTLGGGIGRLSRTHGLAADNLVSVHVVTADGRCVTASENEHGSLFWAICGGGGNFGVVTSLEFRLHDIGPQVWGGAIGYRIEDAPQVLRVVRDLMVSPSHDLNVSAVIVRREGRPMLILNPFWVGDPAAGSAAVRPLREAAPPVIDLYAPTSYLSLQSVDAPGGRRGWESSAFLDQMFDDTIDSLVGYAADAPIAAPRIAILSLGGAVADVPGSATAFGGRGAEWLVSAGAAWDDESDDAAAQAWIEQLHVAVAGDATGIGYVNMLADGRPAYSPWTRARLRAVKTTWDPENLFSSNHNLSDFSAAVSDTAGGTVPGARSRGSRFCRV